MKKLLFTSSGGSQFIGSALLFIFINLFCVRTSAQCGTVISVDPVVEDCGCVKATVYIAGVPSPSVVRSLHMYVDVSNSAGITWDETFTVNSINPKFAITPPTTSFIGGQFNFVYYEPSNNNVFNTPTALFTIRYCGEPGEANVISVGTYSPLALRYRSDSPVYNATVTCAPIFSSAYTRTANNTSRAVSGEVIRPTPASACVGTYDHGIKNVDVRFENVCASLSLPLLSNDVTNTYGEYDFEGVNGGDYRVTMYKDDNPGCGVNSFDILDFTDFILNRHCYDYPWQLIAMDVNINNLITSADKTIIQNYILYSTPLPYSWKFVPVNEYALVTDLCVANNYPTLETYQDFDPLTSAQTAQDWAGIKLGDIDGSCTDCDGTGMFHDGFQGRAIGNPLTMELQAPIKKSGDILDIPITINANTNMNFLILHSRIPKGWDILDIITTCKMNPDYPITFNAENSELKLIVDLADYCSVTPNEPILYIRVKTNGFPSIETEYFQLIESEAFNYIYNNNRVILPLLAKNSMNFSNSAISMKLFPNPSSGNTQIKYNSHENVPVQITIIDQMGRILMNREENGGSASWTVDVNNLPAGLYIVTLSQGANRVIEKLMVK